MIWLRAAHPRVICSRDAISTRVMLIFALRRAALHAGAKGMGKFIDSARFKELNVGFALDEGLACATNPFTVFYGAWLALSFSSALLARLLPTLLRVCRRFARPRLAATCCTGHP